MARFKDLLWLAARSLYGLFQSIQESYSVLFRKRWVVAAKLAAVSQITHDFPRCEGGADITVIERFAVWTEDDSAFL